MPIRPVRRGRRASASARHRRDLTARRLAVLGAALLLGITGLSYSIVPGARAGDPTSTESVIAARWDAVSSPLKSGQVAGGTLFVNLNNVDMGAGGTVDDVTVDLDIGPDANGVYAAEFDPSNLPDLCRTAGVAPTSSVSADGHTLVCDLGTMAKGTAKRIPFAVLATGLKGDQIVLDAHSELTGQDVALAPIPLVSAPGIDVVFDSGTSQSITNDKDTVFDLPFALALPAGSEPLSGPVSFDVRVGDSTITNAATSVRLASPPGGSGHIDATNEQSASMPAPATVINTTRGMTTSVVSEGGGVFRVTLTPPPSQPTWGAPSWSAPSTSSNGTPLAADEQFFAGGAIWFALDDDLQDRAGDANAVGSFTMSVPTASVSATAVASGPFTGEPSGDTTNNATDVVVVAPGTQSDVWARNADSRWDAAFERDFFTNAAAKQGTPWDATPFAVPGDTLLASSNSSFYEGLSAADIEAADDATNAQLCTLLDGPVSFDGKVALAVANGAEADSDYLPTSAISFQYSTDPLGATGAHDENNCGELAWHAASLAGGDGTTYGTISGVASSAITAVKVSVDMTKLGRPMDGRLSLLAEAVVSPTAKAPIDVWSIGAARNTGGGWRTPSALTGVITPTPGSQYASTDSDHDVVHILSFLPIVSKRVDDVSPSKGDVLTYTLQPALSVPLAATGATAQMDVVDTLPPGLAYIPGSASVAPTAVTTTSGGQTSLRWTFPHEPLDQVETITYQASVTGGAGSYTNRAVATSPEVTVPATYTKNQDAVTVKVAGDGTTVLTKTAGADRFALGGQDTWNLTLTSNDDIGSEVFDLIDVLPYDGDGRGSDFHGRQSIDDVAVPPGDVVLYSTVDPRTVATDGSGLSMMYDPASAFNSTDPEGWGHLAQVNTENWSSTKPSDPTTITAIRVIGEGSSADPALPAGATLPFTLTWHAVGARNGDRYDNYAWDRATQTQLETIRGAAASTIVLPTTLQVDKLTDTTTVDPGDTVTFTLTAKNSGANWADDVHVDEHPGYGFDPSSVKVVGAPSAGSFDPATLVWDVGDMAPGALETLRLSFTVTSDFDRRRAADNAVTIHSPENPVPRGDCVPNIGVDADTDQQDCVSLPGYDAPVAIEKHHTAIARDPDGTYTVTWQVQVEGRGPNAPHDVVVTDAYPPGTDTSRVALITVTPPADYAPLAGASPGAGTFDRATGTWTVGDMAVGRIATLVFTTVESAAALTAPAGVTNSVVVDSTEQPYGGGTQPNRTLAEDTDGYDRDTVRVPGHHHVPPGHHHTPRGHHHTPPGHHQVPPGIDVVTGRPTPEDHRALIASVTGAGAAGAVFLAGGAFLVHRRRRRVR